MTRTFGALALVAALAVVGPPAGAVAPIAAPSAIVTARNTQDFARPGETIVLTAAQVAKAMAVDDLRTVHVRDTGSGRDLLVQPVDSNDDGTFDELVFQADFPANQALTFALTTGDRRVFAHDEFKAYGRFVRERRDDFAWENDRVAHRMYGTALETWVQEPLTSSGVDVWVKRTPRLIINDWYMVDDYHRDNGDGADLYSVGRTRGCGGNGLWNGGRIMPSGNFRGSRVLANGPIRVMFELTYEPWDAGGLTVSEVKRVTLDAGQHLNRFESTYTAYVPKPRDLQHAIGIRKNPGADMALSADRGVLRTWEAFKDNAGHLGCGIVIDPASVVDTPQADNEYLVVARVPARGPAVYYAGSAWDKGGDMMTVADWDRHLGDFARRVRAPIEVTLAAR